MSFAFTETSKLRINFMAKSRPLYLPVPYQESAQTGRLILRDGSTAVIRAAGAQDKAELAAFFQKLSSGEQRDRFFPMLDRSEDFLEALCDSQEPRRQLTLLVTRTVGGSSRVIAVGGYASSEEATAEIALAVDDEFRGRGLATLLLERLAILAARHGFLKFKGVTHVDNQAMIEVFRRSGFPLREKREKGIVEVDLSVVPSQSSVAMAEIRDRVFTTASLRPFFKPRSVAVIGASRRADSLGFRILEALLMNRFQGPVYPVNRSAAVVGSMRSYACVSEIPEAVDLAIIAVPKEGVLEVVDDCARRGVRALVVITAGFAEVDSGGKELQKRLLEKVRGYGMRMVGPNCMGLLNTDPSVRMNASFSPVFPPAGRVAMSSQSGALGVAILALAQQLQVGLSTFVSVGNKADVSGNDLLQYWEEDENTSVILLYLESFGNPRRFARIARRVSRSKPIVVVKSGRTLAGRRAAGSHTAALAASDVAVDALFRQTGVIRAETLQEMFDLALTLSNQPLPLGRRVAILTNAGGPGILCADTCEANRLQVPELSDETRGRLARFLPVEASKANPVDMIASAGPEHYRQAVEILLEAPEVDSIVVIFVPLNSSEIEGVVQALQEGIGSGRQTESGSQKPVLACLMGEKGASSPLRLADETIPTYIFPEAAARVLAKVALYSDWRRNSVFTIPDFSDCEPARASQTCLHALQGRQETWLSFEEVREVLNAFRLPLVHAPLATTSSEAAQLAREAGFPVAVKLASREIVHKTELGVVHLNLESESEVEEAFQRIRSRLEQEQRLDAMDGVLVQPMVSGGVELMVGVTDDPVFGPLIAFGLGGIHVEVLGDVQFRVTPLTESDADAMIRGVRGFKLLKGYRGHPPADIESIREILLRVSRLVEEVPEIKELDLNPVFALPPGRGCRIVDARILVR